MAVVPFPIARRKLKITVNWNIIIIMGIKSAYGAVSAAKPGNGTEKSG